MPNEPLADAHDMASAVLRLLTDLHDDDPGDNDAHVGPRLIAARTLAQNLVNAIREMRMTTDEIINVWFVTAVRVSKKAGRDATTADAIAQRVTDWMRDEITLPSDDQIERRIQQELTR